jgi:hypothetical protein
MFLLDEACKPIRQAFRTPPYLVGTAAVRGLYRDVDVRLILDDDEYDCLAGQRQGIVPFLGLAIGEYLAARTGLPIDFQVQRQTEANAQHAGPRNPLGVRSLANYAGDAQPSQQPETTATTEEST